MLQDGFVAKKFRKYRFSIIALASVVGLAVVGGAAPLRLTKYPDYWLSAAGLGVPAILPILAPLVRESSDSAPDRLNKAGKDLAEAVRDQWSRNVARISDPYPLEVPFSVVTTATVDPSDFPPETEWTDAPRGGAAGH